MSEEDVGLVRQSVDAFNLRDKTAWLATFDPEAEMFPAPDWPENAPIRSAEAIWDFYVEVTGAWEEGSFELGEIIESGTDKVAVNTWRETRGKASGAGITFSYWSVTTLRDGRAIRVEWSANRADALEAAGVRE
jgi:ketosteroid isomerase-like protein